MINLREDLGANSVAKSYQIPPFGVTSEGRYNVPTVKKTFPSFSSWWLNQPI